VNDVLSQVRGIDGPFRTAVPTTLTDLQKQVRATHAAVDKAKGDAKKSAAVRSGVRKMQLQVTTLSNQESADRQLVGGKVSDKLAELTGSKVSQVTVDTVGPSWGREISQKARNALIVFLIAITLYITLRFEFRMAVATLAALVHDLVIVVGIYAVFGFPVTPATVIAILTILGFSIYDGIVVFDRVDENTKLLGKRAKITYSEMANTSLNQVLMRSLNTSITALLPILSVLVIGAGFLGATTLEEFGLALFLGLLSGAYSSIFIATPLLAMLKEREPRYRDLRARVEAQHAAAAAAPPAGAAGADGSATVATDVKTSRGRSLDEVAGAAPAGSAPRPRKQGKKR
jgi:preprotein translocase subunit SecF